MSRCVKCDLEFQGLGLVGSPMQNMHTGQWVCIFCYRKLCILDQTKYVLI
jgi:hypothetical protein